MNKTYFEQLLDLYETTSNKNDVVQYLYKDSVRRCLDFRDGYYEEGLGWENSTYIKRNLEFIKQCIDR